MIDLRIVDETSYAELREFRRRVFHHELEIQSGEYQDVFNDHFSKNVVLRSGDGSLLGAVRLAFSREKQRFYISYLTLSAECRSGTYVRLLLGAIFHLARKNGIVVLHGDATDDNLPMYLAAGCRQVGTKYRKYGFHTEWTPVEYVMGTQRQNEEMLSSRVAPLLEADRCHWQFRPRMLLCADARQYRAQLTRLIADRGIFGSVPHLGGPFAIHSDTVRPEQVPISGGGLQPRADDERELADVFARYNDSFSARHLIVMRHDSPWIDIGRTYAMLTGKRLVHEWPPASGVDSVMLILQPTELGDLPTILANRSRDWMLGIACAESASALSQMLLRSYLEFFARSGRREPQVHPNGWLHPHQGDGSRHRADLDGSVSHAVFSMRSHDRLGEVRERLASLLRTGLPIGTVVQRLDAGDQQGSHHWLLGDPCLSFFPNEVSELPATCVIGGSLSRQA